MSTSIQDPLGHGAVSPDQETILRQFLNPALRGNGWTSMIAALATGDQRNADNARLAFDQLFLSSASGAYLDRRASDEGISRPKGVNMSDSLFRKLALTQRNNKLTQKSLLDVLEIFYGLDATRASSDASVNEMYALQDADELVILFEERNTVTVIFERTHFSHISAATAEEVAAAITRACRDAGNAGFAISTADPVTGENKVRIYSGTLGLTSSVRIIGGSANLALLFPTPLFEQTTSSPFATWDIQFSPDTEGNLRFTMTGGAEYNLFLVQTGDLVYIYGPEFADSANGTFDIKAVKVTSSTQWFEINNPIGVESLGVVQTKFTDLMFFRPKRKTIYDNTRRVVVCENDGYLDIIIPATTQVVDRGPGLAAYLNPADPVTTSESPSVIRTPDGTITIEFGQTESLAVGDQVIIDGAYPTGTPPTIDAGSPSGDFPSDDSTADGSTNAGIQTTASQCGTYDGVWSKAVRTPEGRLMIVGGWTTPDGVTVTPKTTITMLEVNGEGTGAHGGDVVSYLWTSVSNDGTHGFSGYLSGPRAFSASLLKDGRVLVVGGTSNTADLTGSGFAGGYDLFTFIPPNAISQQGNGTLPGIGAGQAQDSYLDVPSALVCGGYVSTTPIANTWVYDGVLDSWNNLANMNVARYNHALVALDDESTFLAIGGLTNLDGSTTVGGGGLTSAPGTLARCELYDRDLDAWTLTGNMAYARSAFGVVKIPDGRVIVFGGRGYRPCDIVSGTTTPQTLKTVEIFDPNTGQWNALPSMRFGREYPVCAYMPETNEVWVTSGAAGVFATEILDVEKMKWRAPQQANIQTAHTHATGGLLGNQVFTMIGGDVLNATEKVNHILVPGSDRFWAGAGINGIHRVASIPTGSKIIIENNDYADYSSYFTAQPGWTVTPMRANPTPPSVPGPFSYDPKNGFAITAINGTTDTVFNKGARYTSMHLEGANSALAFPDEPGWLVFNFGYKNVVGPIRYLGRLGDEDLFLDPAVPFSATLPAGATVRLLTGKVPFEPAADKLVGNFYVTGIAAGREAAKQIIDDIVAAGKQVLVTILYPGDRGLGADGFPQGSNYKLSDKVAVWGGDQLDSEIPAARSGP